MSNRISSDKSIKKPKGHGTVVTSERERILELIVQDLHWMARRYANGRMSYVTSMFNEHTQTLLNLGVELNPANDGTIWARDGMGHRFEGPRPKDSEQHDLF